MVISNKEYVERCFQLEYNSETLARQNFQRLDQIMRGFGPIDSDIHDRIMDIKVLRMKKTMLKHGSVFLKKHEAEEIWENDYGEAWRS